MSLSAISLVHVFPYCHKVSGGHANAIHAFLRAEAEAGLNAYWVCPACDTARLLPELRDGHVTVHPAIANPLAAEAVTTLPLPNRQLVFCLHAVDAAMAKLARALTQAQVPYTVNSQGALHFRGPLHWAAKCAYLNLLSPVTREASGLHFLTQRERRRFQWLMPHWRRPVVVAANVVAPPDPNGVTAANRATFGIPADAFLFMFLGRLHLRHKGLDLLLQAFAQIAENRRLALAFVGPDWEGGRTQLAHLAKRWGCASQTHFIEPQFGAAKWSALKMANAFVSPSRWDAFNIALVEAIGFGLPTVTTPGVNLAFELDQAGAALVSRCQVPSLARAMQQLANDRVRGGRLSTGGREWVLAHCAAPVVGPALGAFYRQVLEAAA